MIDLKKGGDLLRKKKKTPPFSFLGFGLGLRSHFFSWHEKNPGKFDWLELISDNFISPQKDKFIPSPSPGRNLKRALNLRRDTSMVLHGVSMSLGTTDPINYNYLKQLKNLISAIEPNWVSDHLCWTGVNKQNTHDLLPLPYTTEALEHLVRRILQVQDFLKRPLLIENVSSYVEFSQSTMTEWEFISELCNKSGCYLLLDINNVFVSSQNHGFDPFEFLDCLPQERVVQIHLAGHSVRKTKHGEFLIDTHDAPVRPEVWELYSHYVNTHGVRSTMIERDSNYPKIEELIEEVEHAKQLAEDSARLSENNFKPKKIKNKPISFEIHS
ncbi:MAG: DUF692 domain-containing protein [Bacteriovoracia bacterium]